MARARITTPAYRLRTDSQYKAGGVRDATDGKDLGVDFVALDKALGGEANAPGATSGVRGGTWDAYGKEVVIYAKDCTRVGSWNLVTDLAAAGGQYVQNVDNDVADNNSPLSSPSHYITTTFTAQAGVPYRLWVRMKGVQTNDDSIWVQFNQSVTSAGGAIWRIGTTTGTRVELEDTVGAGISGWGWQDNGTFGAAHTPVYFSVSGTQTIRIQRREDGPAIDQIVLSPCTYLGGGPAQASPGTLKNDTTILIKQ
jgi:hypothetical protein